jgi:hypothetical protein
MLHPEQAAYRILPDALNVVEMGDCRMYPSFPPRKELSNHASP